MGKILLPLSGVNTYTKLRWPATYTLPNKHFIPSVLKTAYDSHALNSRETQALFEYAHHVWWLKEHRIKQRRSLWKLFYYAHSDWTPEQITNAVQRIIIQAMRKHERKCQHKSKITKFMHAVFDFDAASLEGAEVKNHASGFALAVKGAEDWSGNCSASQKHVGDLDEAEFDDQTMVEEHTSDATLQDDTENEPSSSDTSVEVSHQDIRLLQEGHGIVERCASAIRSVGVPNRLSRTATI